ncbi:hypothetical protein Trydic_g980 [Trypoxylus dichotomus]
MSGCVEGDSVIVVGRCCFPAKSDQPLPYKCNQPSIRPPANGVRGGVRVRIFIRRGQQLPRRSVLLIVVGALPYRNM